VREPEGQGAGDDQAEASDLTVLIEAWQGGSGVPVDALWQAAYSELKKVARARLRGSGPHTVLDTTALVNESYLKLAKLGRLQVESRGKFFAYASRVMRSVVVDLVRERQAERRGGGVAPVTLDTAVVDGGRTALAAEPLRVDEALAELEGRAAARAGSRDALLRRSLGARDRRRPRTHRPHRAPRLAEGQAPAALDASGMSRLPCPAELWPEFSRLLDQALDQPVAGRQAWLDSLPPAHRNLVPYLQSVLTVGNDSPSLAPDALAALTPGTVDGSGEVRDDDAFAPLAGEQVGPYTLERELGRGGMGMVWLAARSDGAYERQVALKLPHTHLGGSATLRRFRRERDILATLSHPNIAQFLDAGLTPTGHPYLALELVSGVPITEACRTGRQPLAVRVGLVRDVAAALHAAHARLIVHRDIKPSNVMVASDGTVKLLDFGIAKLLETDETGESNAAFTQLTVEGTRIATPDYAAPEQLTGAPITVATDVYSLAVLLYELLTGRRPFDRAAGPRAAPAGPRARNGSAAGLLPPRPRARRHRRGDDAA
jgi:RNA polymerase sigma factor (TIGR02999 family)